MTCRRTASREGAAPKAVSAAGAAAAAASDGFVRLGDCRPVCLAHATPPKLAAASWLLSPGW